MLLSLLVIAGCRGGQRYAVSRHPTSSAILTRAFHAAERLRTYRFAQSSLTHDHPLVGLPHRYDLQTTTVSGFRSESPNILYESGSLGIVNHGIPGLHNGHMHWVRIVTPLVAAERSRNQNWLCSASDGAFPPAGLPDSAGVARFLGSGRFMGRSVWRVDYNATVGHRQVGTIPAESKSWSYWIDRRRYLVLKAVEVVRPLLRPGRQPFYDQRATTTFGEYGARVPDVHLPARCARLIGLTHLRGRRA